MSCESNWPAGGRERLDAVLKRHDLASVVLEFVVLECQVAVADAPCERTLEQAAQGACGLIVRASRGRGAVASALLGSQTLHVLKHAHGPVMVVK